MLGAVILIATVTLIFCILMVNLESNAWRNSKGMQAIEYFILGLFALTSFIYLLVKIYAK
jgi:hypothetical protein